MEGGGYFMLKEVILPIILTIATELSKEKRKR